MKKVMLSLACAACVMSVSAQRASDSALSFNENKSYNRVGVSYVNNNYGFNDAMKAEMSWNEDEIWDGMNLNGVGVDYIHGFSLSQQLPMFLEVGANFNFNFGSKTVHESKWSKYDFKMTNINLTVPVNFAYRFAVNDDFAVTPYIGINFKLNLTTTGKEKYFDKEDGITEESPAYNFLSKEGMAKYLGGWEEGDEPVTDEEKELAKDFTWNRFQMGWQVGVGFQYKPFYLGVQYGTDFIPAYSHKFTEDGIKFDPKVNCGTLKVSLGYTF